MRFGLIFALLLVLVLAPRAALAVRAPAPAPAVPGIQIAPAVEGLHHPTRLLFGPDGRLYVAQQTGEVVTVSLQDGRRQVVAKASHDLLGIALRGDTLFVSDTGRVIAFTRQADGTFGAQRAILPDVPHGLHHPPVRP